MATIEQKIAEIKFEFDRTQKNKATNAHLGILRARIAKLERELVTPKGGSGGGPGEGFDVKHTGSATIGLIGFPSVGKSTLMNVLTGQESRVAAYDFTTLTCIPGEFKYRGARMQLLDLPGIIEGAKEGRGRGRQVITVARSCDLIIMVLDALKPMLHKVILESELHGFGIRLNQQPPNISFVRKDKGGITFTHTVSAGLTKVDEDTVKAVLHEYKIHNANITFREDASLEQLIDVIEGNRVYVPCVYAMNKIDQLTIEELDVIAAIPRYIPISAHHRWNLEELLEEIWDQLKLIRIYTKPPGQIPDYAEPVVVQDGCTVDLLCRKIHKSLADDFKAALVWGTSVKHHPQRVGRDHILHDEDVIQILKKV